MTLARTLFLLVLPFFMVMSLYAQTPLTKQQQDAFKQEVLLKAKNTTTLSSDFIQSKHLSMLDNAIVSNGKMLFKAPENIRWEYTSPKPYAVIFKDEMLYVNNDGKKDEIKLSSNKLFRNFNTLIVQSVNGTMFDDSQFDMSYFKLDSGYLVRFLPKEKRLKRFVSAFELTFTETAFDVAEVKIVEPNDDYTLVVFKNRSANISISEEKFKL